MGLLYYVQKEYGTVASFTGSNKADRWDMYINGTERNDIAVKDYKLGSGMWPVRLRNTYYSFVAWFYHLRGEPRSQAKICAHCGAYTLTRVKIHSNKKASGIGLFHSLSLFAQSAIGG